MPLCRQRVVAWAWVSVAAGPAVGLGWLLGWLSGWLLGWLSGLLSGWPPDGEPDAPWADVPDEAPVGVDVPCWAAVEEGRDVPPTARWDPPAVAVDGAADQEDVVPPRCRPTVSSATAEASGLSGWDFRPFWAAAGSPAW